MGSIYKSALLMLGFRKAEFFDQIIFSYTLRIFQTMLPAIRIPLLMMLLAIINMVGVSLFSNSLNKVSL